MDDDENDPYPIGADLERRFYLSSKKLMIYFTNQVFDDESDGDGDGICDV